MKPIEYLYLTFLVLALVLIYFAFKFYSNTKNLTNSGIKTKAEVIDLIQISSNDGYTYKPVFEYTDGSNTKRTFQSEIGSSPAPYKVGEKVDIIYSKDGEDRKIVSFWGLYRWTIILLSIASPFLIIGGGYFLYSWS
ncbi:DUF3592 domain-containing protein [Aureibaculum sp. 2210JD6-5]|uniref:DUF3592 domain-containing protein n=1 Tax=Aureibaculum sp. 2210JD6-5 TaxID=3103957 RepID=UPI002AAD3400|nr:DUF3592 domain-containing protein [Aureibaculum sp. 2210JD6-5]MDY7396369.1 DUF3592 domain-containing protein [Aureibaculum sp. 2210JD6-5]